MNGIRVQDARFQQLVVQYQNTVLTANAEAENALVGFLEAQQQVKYLATSAQAAEQSYEPGRGAVQRGQDRFQPGVQRPADAHAAARPVGGRPRQRRPEPGPALQGPRRRLADSPGRSRAAEEAEPAAQPAESVPAPLPEEKPAR